MNEEKINCVIHIYDDELYNIMAIIGSICRLSPTPIKIIKCEITCRNHGNINSQILLDLNNTSDILKRYKSLFLDDNINNNIKNNMPDFADLYITTNFNYSHIMRKQYNKYVLLYYDEKQLTTINEEKKISNKNVNYFDIVISLPDMSLPQNILFSNEYINIDKNCIKKIMNLKLKIKIKTLNINDNVVNSLNKFVIVNNITQILDLECYNISLAKPNIKYYHCNSQNKNIFKTLKYNTQTKFTLSNNKISDLNFIKMLITLNKDNTIVLLHNVLQYAPFSEIISIIQNLCNINFKYISISSIQTMIQIHNEWTNVDTNTKDISYGGYRPINLNNKPYNLATPHKIYFNETIKQESNYKEYEYIHLYSYAEFLKLKNINENFTKHSYVPFNKTHSVENEYIIYEIKDIDKMNDNIFSNNNSYYSLL
jgi:hypothetical protein